MAQMTSRLAGRVPDAALNAVLSRVDEDDACQLAMDICAIPSPTGEEGPVAEFMLDWMARQGLRTIRQEVEDGRLNAVGILAGAGDGKSLMINGHLDTGTHVIHEDVVGIAPKPEASVPSRREDGVLYGVGMDNMKSGVAAFMIAAKAIKQSGVKLKADLILAGVCGEIGRAPVDQYQGRWYRSKGVGTRYLLTHGVVSDYAIVADVSHFTISWAECGVLYVKVSTHARAFYTPFTSRTPRAKDSPNAIVRMQVLVAAIERWAEDYERRSVYEVGAAAELSGGEIRPKASIGAIIGGGGFRVANTAPSCSVYVDIRVRPGQLPIEVLRDLQAALAATGIEHTIEPYLTQRGYENQGVEPLVDAVQQAHRFVIGKPPAPVHSGETSMWNDTNLYEEAGIPTVKYGIGGVLKKVNDGERFGQMRVIDTTAVDDLITGAKVYAASVLAVCGVDG
jgi:acetylornithine deacetylase/succinyl-diaminopimelate desuccinylase-like protein